jgi:hypothetical protein
MEYWDHFIFFGQTKELHMVLSLAGLIFLANQKGIYSIQPI